MQVVDNWYVLEVGVCTITYSEGVIFIQERICFQFVQEPGSQVITGLRHIGQVQMWLIAHCLCSDHHNLSFFHSQPCLKNSVEDFVLQMEC